MIDSWVYQRFPGASVTPITDGWSDDQKLRITTPKEDYLLRISPFAALPRKQAEFAQLQRCGELSDAFPRAMACEAAPDGAHCFVLYSWLEGSSALDVLPNLADGDQHRLGVDAGRLLRRMHDLSQTLHLDSHGLIRQKVAIRRQQMREAGLSFPGYEAMVAYLDTHLDPLRNAPTSFRHGDFHLGNMLIDTAGRLRIIDFNRSDFGDPMEDLSRLFTFSRKHSLAFVHGQIAGYFGIANPPATFFEHVLCYIMVDCAFGLLWAQRFGQREIDFHFALMHQVMADFDHLQGFRPKWFKP